MFHKIEISRNENAIVKPSYAGVPRVVGQEDEKFLDDLFQQQDQKVQRAASAGVKPDNDLATAQSDLKPVRRAELIVNTSRVKRAQLVVNRRVVERGELVRSKLQ